MNKVIDIFGNEITFDCMGCDIANHKLIPPGGYVYDDGFINVSADPEIPIEAFMVLGINKHIKSINELNSMERNKIMDILNKTIEIIRKTNISNEVMIIQEEKAKHFHIWIVPIHKWMEKFQNNVRNIKEIIDYAKQNFTKQKESELLGAIDTIRREFNKISKEIRKAVRCYLVEDNKVVAIKYNEHSKKAGYYDIPGGKIEKNETPKQAAIREMKEETGLTVSNLKYRGNMIIEYPDRIYDFDVFLTNECNGEPQDFSENTSEWIDIPALLSKEKILSSLMILNSFYINGLLENNNFYMYIKVDENENILDVSYNLIIDNDRDLQ